MAHRTVLKVTIPCEKCKRKLLKSVSKLQGVYKMDVDESKGTLTVIGEVDTYKVIVRARKAGLHVEVITIGLLPAPPKKPDEKKADEKKPEPKKDKKKDKKKTKVKAQQLYPCPFPSYPRGEIAFIQMGPYNEPGPLCPIM